MDTPPHDRQHLETSSSQSVCASPKWGGLYLIAAFGACALIGGAASSNAHAQASNSDTFPTGIEIIPTDLPAHASSMPPANQPISLLPGTIPMDDTIKEDLEIPSLATQYHQTLIGKAPVRRATTVRKAKHTVRGTPNQPPFTQETIPNSSEFLATATPTSSAPPTGSKPKSFDPNAKAYLIQLGAFRDTISAETYWASFRIRYPELSKTYAKQIVSADLGTKGIYHRLQLVGFTNPDLAKQKCRQLKTDGTDCFAIQP